MAAQHFDFQLDWDVAPLHERWVNGPDVRFLFRRLAALTVDTTLAGGARRVLDVAAAEASHTAEIRARGVAAVALDPSPTMLAQARAGMAARGVRFDLVRGLAEGLPFRSGAFDRVLCHSAIDHVADPDLAVREMARVLEPEGRLVLSAVNYGGLSVRLSRALYRAARRLRLLPDETEQHQAWDTPVPAEHTFECSLERLRQLCDPYLELDRSFGASIGWGVPGWRPLLEHLPAAGAQALLSRLDRRAQRSPDLADFLYLVLRPRPPRTWHVWRAPEQGGFVVQPTDVTYPFRATREINFSRLASYTGTLFQPGRIGDAWANTAYTGDPGRSWLADLTRRGPFRNAALLGCDDDRREADWLRGGGSTELDVYELSPYAIRKVRAGLGPLRRRVRFIQADLNFAELPAGAYDVIWSSGCLHHVINLEHLLAQIDRALRPGGLFAVHDFIGERRVQFSPARLARLNALLEEIPPRFRRGGLTAVTAPPLDHLSPFCGMRPADLLPLARARFTPLHVATFGRLFPLPLVLDLDSLASQAPPLLARLQAAEAEAARDPALLPATAYAVFRKR
ncbi:MAG: class I SAM-dependent methyltransferase [Candidatus Binatia bacterium]